ncbi:hypothetical protein GB937_007040 [Aspergillus fischeri]|nr:hypothetical protein GB937_007040 [Aspergillus fischeri]
MYKDREMRAAGHSHTEQTAPVINTRSLKAGRRPENVIYSRLAQHQSQCLSNGKRVSDVEREK